MIQIGQTTTTIPTTATIDPGVLVANVDFIQIWKTAPKFSSTVIQIICQLSRLKEHLYVPPCSKIQKWAWKSVAQGWDILQIGLNIFSYTRQQSCLLSHHI